MSALALDAAPDLAAATQQLLTKLQSQSEQLDARNNELETLKVVQVISVLLFFFLFFFFLAFLLYFSCQFQISSCEC